MFLVVSVRGPSGGGQATSSFLHGRVFGTVRRRLFFVPCRSKAGRSRLFETPLNLIFFCGYECEFFVSAQCLIQRRLSTLIVLLEHRFTVVVDGEHAILDVEPFRSKRGFRQ